MARLIQPYFSAVSASKSSPPSNDLDRPRSPHQQWKALGRAAARNQAEPNLRLAEDGPLPAREPDVAAECALHACTGALRELLSGM